MIESNWIKLKQSFSLLIVAVLLITAGLSFVPASPVLPYVINATKGDDQVVNRAAPTAITDSGIDFSLFWNVWDLVEKKSIARPISEKKLFYGALKGMVDATGDPYTTYFDPETAKKFADDLSGTFTGIGAEIGMRNNQLTIVAPLPGTPAAKAGVKAGDAILSIDGIDTRSLTLDEAVRKIRGAKNTVVKLLLMREGWTKPKEFPITRNTITIESVKWHMLDKKELPKGVNTKAKIAYIKLSSFDNRSVEEFRKALQESIPLNPSGYVIDLRNNPGGLLDAAVEISGEWINNNLVVTEQMGSDASAEKIEYRSKNQARLNSFPTVVLVNQGSASASEILAGALQDYGYATLVGQKTFGKGSVQELINLPDGSSVKITIAKWLTPHGRNINKNGIEPDIKVEITDKDEAAKKDPQLESAIKALLKKVK